MSQECASDTLARALAVAASGLTPVAREALRAIPAAHTLVVQCCSSESCPEDTSEDDLLNALSYLQRAEFPTCNHTTAALVTVLGLCLSNEDRVKIRALQALSHFNRHFDRAHAPSWTEIVAEVVQSPVFKASKEMLDLQASSRLLPMIEDTLRQGDHGIRLVMKGLYSPESFLKKQALYICRQLVSNEARPDGANVLCPPKAESSLREWHEQWDLFFMAYETFQEPQAHLLEQLLPYLSRFLAHPLPEGLLGMDFYACLVATALGNSSIAVRRRMLEHLVVELDWSQYTVLSKDESFAFGVLLRELDSSYLYSAIDFTRLVSPFGTAVSQFYLGYIMLASDPEAIQERAKAFLHSIGQMSSNLAIMFVLNSLVELSFDKTFLGLHELEILRELSSHKAFHNARAREMLRWQLLQVAVRYCDPRDVPFKELCHTLWMLSRELDISFASGRHRHVAAWLGALPDLDASLCQYIEEGYFEYRTGLSSSAVSKLEEKAESIAAVATLIAADRPKLGGSVTDALLRNLNTCLQQGGEMLGLSKTVILLSAMERRIRAVSGGRIGLLRNLHVPEKLFSLLVRLDEMLIPDVGGPRDTGILSPAVSEEADYALVRSLVGGMETVVGELLSIAGATDHDLPDNRVERMLVEYLDIMVIRNVQWLDHLFASQQRLDRTPEPYCQQLVKVSVLAGLRIVFTAFTRMRFPSNGGPFSAEVHIPKLLATTLDKPTGLSDEQWDAWPSLAEALIEHKWKAVTAYAALLAPYSAANHITIDLLFREAVERLPHSQYQSSVAIIECLSEILRVSAEMPGLQEKVAMATDACEAFIEATLGERSRWSLIYMYAVIDGLFQPSLVARPELHSAGAAGPGPLLRLFRAFLYHIAPSRRGGILPRLLQNLYSVLKSRPEIRKCYQPDFKEILMYGPVRPIPEERLAMAFN